MKEFGAKVNKYASLLYINGKKFKQHAPDGSLYVNYDAGYKLPNVNNPIIGYVEQSEQLVKQQRNAEGKLKYQKKINRRLNKFENLTWPYLSRYDVTWLKNEIAKFECTVGYYDDEANKFIERKYYWGDFEATPCKWETVIKGGKQYKRPTWYKDVKCNLIDMGW